jgi:hypothetical protein
MSQGKTIYSSLPPQLIGIRYGEVIIRISKIISHDSSHLIGYKARFHWWGQNPLSDEITLNLPWKIGIKIEEAIFPIRSTRDIFEKYLFDMNELEIMIYNENGIPFGNVIISMKSVINYNLIYRQSLSVMKYGDSRKVVGKIFLEFVCQFEEKSENPEMSNPKLSVFQRVEVSIEFSREIIH